MRKLNRTEERYVFRWLCALKRVSRFTWEELNIVWDRVLPLNHNHYSNMMRRAVRMRQRGDEMSEVEFVQMFAVIVADFVKGTPIATELAPDLNAVYRLAAALNPWLYDIRVVVNDACVQNCVHPEAADPGIEPGTF